MVIDREGVLNILIADDHELIREGVKQVLKDFDSSCVVIEAQDYAQTLRIVRENFRLDLILLDLAMPGMERMDGLRHVRDAAPSVPIIVLSVYESYDDVKAALDNGANGYVPKSSANNVLPGAISLVLNGDSYIPGSALLQPDITTGSNYQYQNYDPLQTTKNYFNLTNRQIEVLKYLSEGRSNKEIAKLLSISEPTIKSHLSNIFHILNASNRTEAVRIALKSGIISDN